MGDKERQKMPTWKTQRATYMLRKRNLRRLQSTIKAILGNETMDFYKIDTFCFK